MTAVEAARQALHHLDTDTAPGTSPGDVAGSWAALKCVVALRDLLAEIDSGVWLDTRELAALGSVDLTLNNARSEVRAPLWRVTQSSEPGGSWVALTAVDAVRAARGATDA